MKEIPEWNSFENACLCCKKCDLANTRNKVVVGRGSNRNARIMLVGEGPGEQEDLTGQAFVGRAGKLLDNLLNALMFEPEDYYICNIVKCRPPGNREPLMEEVFSCMPWLRYQVKYIKPNIIVCLGAIALKYLVGEDARITKIRGNWIERPSFFKIMPTYHPAAVLRDSNKKEELFCDMKKVKKYLDIIKQTS